MPDHQNTTSSSTAAIPRALPVPCEWAGSKGFFAAYNAKPQDAPDQHTAHRWINGFTQLVDGTLDANALAQKLATDSAPIATKAFCAYLRSRAGHSITANAELPATGAYLPRGAACQILYDTYFQLHRA